MTNQTKRISRFLQIASSSPNAKSRQVMLERKADQILRRSGFYKPMDEAEKLIRQEAQSYALRSYYNVNR